MNSRICNLNGSDGLEQNCLEEKDSHTPKTFWIGAFFVVVTSLKIPVKNNMGLDRDQHIWGSILWEQNTALSCGRSQSDT